MWSTRIKSTAFTTAAARNAITNVTGATYDEDVTFISTLKAVMPKRIGGDLLKFTTWFYENESDFLQDTYMENCSLNIINLRNMTENNMRGGIYSSLDCEGYTFLDKVAVFFQKSFPVYVFVNTERKISLVFLSGLNLPKFHLLQCAIPVFLPWYFQPDNPITETEMRLFKSCQQNTATEYLKILEEIANEYDFRTLYIREALTAFESKGLEQKLAIVNSNIIDLMDKIERHYSQIRELMDRKRELNIDALGLKNMVDNAAGGTEIADYFSRSKYLELVDVFDGRVTFVVKDQLRFWGSETGSFDLDREYSNENSFLYKPEGNKIPVPHEYLEKFWRAVFESQKISIKTYGVYGLRIGNWEYMPRLWRDDAICSGYMFNPHIFYHYCLGDYGKLIQQSLDNGDFIGAVEHCITSTRSINLDEVGPTVSPWVWALYNSPERCVILPNGEEVTCKEAIKWVIEGGLD